jgi:hypothetical protein
LREPAPEPMVPQEISEWLWARTRRTLQASIFVTTVRISVPVRPR